MGSPEPTILRHALVVDGTGAPARSADVVVRAGVISEVGVAGTIDDAEEVDLSGLVLAPGFIDVHTHYDAQILWDPDLTPSSWHGVTTVVIGNCGFGVAPTAAAHRDAIIGTLENVEGMSAEALAAGIDWSFETFPEYLDALERVRPRLNVAAMVGHTPLRLSVMGLERATEPATPAELATMEDRLAEALSAGAIGFASSKSLDHQGYRGMPVPSRAAEMSEIEALVRVAGRTPGSLFQATSGPGLFVDQFAALAQATGVPITWTALLTGVGRPGTATHLLDRTTELGGAVWPQISCRPLAMQISLLDPFPFGRFASFQRVLQADRADRHAIYADRAWRDVARREVDAGWKNSWEKVSVQETGAHAELRDGPSLAEIARADGTHPLDVMIDLALAEDLATRFRVVLANDDEDELAILLADDRPLLGLSDAGAHASQLCDACFSTHLLGHWVRERGALSLEKAVWRLTGQPADVLGLHRRGRIAPGLQADLVAFDPATVGPGAMVRTHDLPAGAERLLATGHGIEHVWVDGVPIRRDGVDVAGARPGEVLRDPLRR